MTSIKNTLEALKPYFIGIRYLEGTPLVDVVFKEDWVVPEDKLIKAIKGNEEVNYYMIFSEVVGIDELLDFVSKTIKLNEEREKKHELLKHKINELKELFKINSLNKLKKLKFVLNDEELIPEISDLDINTDNTTEFEPNKNNFVEEDIIENHEKVELNYDEEEAEIVAEELRAEKNRKFLANKNKHGFKPKVDLPPKKMFNEENNDGKNGGNNGEKPICKCGPNEACQICIDSKGF